MNGVQDTSLKAYFEEKESGNIGKAEKAVFEVLQFQNKPMTDRQIAYILGYEDMNKVRPRRNGLVSKGLVEAAGKTKCEYTGKVVKTWRVKK